MNLVAWFFCRVGKLVIFLGSSPEPARRNKRHVKIKFFFEHAPKSAILQSDGFLLRLKLRKCDYNDPEVIQKLEGNMYIFATPISTGIISKEDKIEIV